MANSSIDYIAKDFDSIVDALITFATVNFGEDSAGNRQWTNFNEDDFSRTWLEIVAYVGDLIFYYLDVQATQSNLETATIRSAVLDIAKQFGYIVPTASSASGLATFTLNTSDTIPVGFRVSADNGAEFFTTSSSPQAGSTTLSVILPVIQGEQRSETFTAKGVQNEEVVLGFTPLVIDTTNSVSTLRSPRITVNGNSYDLVNTFIDSLPTDRHYRVVTNEDGQTVIRFGDGIFGEALAPNDTIVVSYRTGGGTVGNIPASTLNTLVDEATFIDSVINTESFSGGADDPTIDRLRELIPASLQTLERAVAVDDYGDIIVANFSNVLKAAAEENITDSGVDVDIYVVPSGTTITPITTNLSLFNSITDYIDKRKTVTTTFRLLDANGVDVDLKLTAFLLEGASRTEVAQDITTAFTTFFDLSEGDTDGAGTKFGQRVLLNDLYALLDDIEGIERFEITKFNYIPRIEPTTASGTNYLQSEVEVLTPSEPSEWLVASEYNAASPDYNPFTVYKRLTGTVSNLSADSLADDDLNLAVVESTTSAVNTEGSNNVVFDNSRTFVVDEFVGGGFLLVDSSNNIWNITDNDAHSIILGANAINNTVVSDVSSGSYKIVRSMIGQNLIFRNLVFSNIDFNTHNTLYRIGSSFDLVGTIGDEFKISIPQTNIGNFGAPVTITAFTSSTPTAGTGRVTLAGNPDLSSVTVGPSSNYLLIDSNSNVFEVIAVDDINKTVDIIHQAGVTTAPTVSGGKPASLAPRYYSDDSEVTFVIGQGNRETGIGFQARGNIQTVDPANISDAETFVLNDGSNPAVTFEFEKTGGVGGGNVAVDISSATDAEDVRDIIVSAVNGAPLLAITATPGTATNMVILQNDAVGSQGNQTIINGVADAGFITTGMTGGLDSGSLPTPVIPASGKTSTDLGLDTDGNVIDIFVFRVSGYVDDIINLRKSEIPEFSEDNLELDLRGGVA